MPVLLLCGILMYVVCELLMKHLALRTLQEQLSGLPEVPTDVMPAAVPMEAFPGLVTTASPSQGPHTTVLCLCFVRSVWCPWPLTPPPPAFTARPPPPIHSLSSSLHSYVLQPPARTTTTRPPVGGI